MQDNHLFWDNARPIVNFSKHITKVWKSQEVLAFSSHLQTDEPNYCLSTFSIKYIKVFRESNLVHFFDNGTKMKINSEISPPSKKEFELFDLLFNLAF